MHSKFQCVLSLVPLPKMDEMYVMLNGSTVYSSLDCTSGYHCIAFLPEAPKISAFVIQENLWFSASSHIFPTFNKLST